MTVRDVSITHLPLRPDCLAESADSVPRVLVCAPAGSLERLVEGLGDHDVAVLLVPSSALDDELRRGAVDLVLLADSPVVLEQVHRVRGLADVPLVVVLGSGATDLDGLFGEGVDDCIHRGASPAEVASRVRAVLRRRGLTPASGVLTAGAFHLDLGRHVCLVRGRPVHLPPKEFGLLELLLGRDGKVVSREEALSRVWGQRQGSDPTTVDVHVKRLRAKLEPDPSRPMHLLTVRKLGYRFQA